MGLETHLVIQIRRNTIDLTPLIFFSGVSMEGRRVVPGGDGELAPQDASRRSR
ncbi:unnamed protein product [Linum tenue]|uniref:Uncharacterized protein n=1 Tax=Linum tenue TaxID=586396 RepID=A0AAV0IY30_9ROSI|nr:unnamed protein product [Linum tenue]